MRATSGASVATDRPATAAQPSAATDRPATAAPRFRRPRPSAAAAALAVAAGATLLVGAPAASAAGCADADLHPAQIGIARTTTAIRCLVDHERVVAGLSPLAPEDRVRTAAQRYAEDMATRQFFAHDSPEGTDPGERLQAAGFRWSAYGENIAAGQESAREVTTAWLASPGHCRNVMTPAFTVAGYGVAFGAGGPYWTQEFARPADGGTTAVALQAPACPRLPAAPNAVAPAAVQQAADSPTAVSAAGDAAPAAAAARSGRRLRVRVQVPAGEGTVPVLVRVRQAGRTVRSSTLHPRAGTTRRMTVRLRAARGGRVLVRAGTAPTVGVSFR